MAFEFDFDLLRELTETSGVPGYEDRVRELARDELAANTDTVRTDAMGNVVGTIEGDSDYSVAVAAHMDEIGFMVKHIDDDGFLKLDALGGWDARVLRAQRVTVHGEEDITGVFGSVPPHTLDDAESGEEEVGDRVVDLGRDAEEVEELVSVGDVVTMNQSTIEMGDSVTGKALDDRVCLFAMLEAAREIENPDVTIHFCATVQEEVGIRGATALGVDVAPDLAIALDVTVANGFSEPVSGIELRVRASNATFTERRRVASRLPASDAASFSFPATAVEPGQQTVTASLTFTTAGGDRQQITRDLTTSVERVRHPGNVTLTGLRLTRENDTLRIRGSTSNLGTTNVSGTLVEVAEGSRTGPADAQHRYFVGGIPASDYASFEVRAELDGPVNESATVPLRVSYVVDDTRITRTVEATYEPRPTDDSNSGGGSSTPLLLGGVLLVGVVGVGYWRWSG